MTTDKAIKAWYSKALQSETEYQLACSAYQNAIDTFPEGESHPDFWRVVWDSREILINSNFDTYRVELDKPEEDDFDRYIAGDR